RPPVRHRYRRVHADAEGEAQRRSQDVLRRDRGHVRRMTQPLAVTFDFGQTLCDIDLGMLSRRLAERGILVQQARLEADLAEAWRAYDAAIHGGLGGHPWKIFMRRLLAVAGVAEADLDSAVDWLWSEQPRRNLWRKPVPGMIEIVD